MTEGVVRCCSRGDSAWCSDDGPRSLQTGGRGWYLCATYRTDDAAALIREVLDQLHHLQRGTGIQACSHDVRRVWT